MRNEQKLCRVVRGNAQYVAYLNKNKFHSPKETFKTNISKTRHSSIVNFFSIYKLFNLTYQVNSNKNNRNK